MFSLRCIYKLYFLILGLIKVVGCQSRFPYLCCHKGEQKKQQPADVPFFPLVEEVECVRPVLKEQELIDFGMQTQIRFSDGLLFNDEKLVQNLKKYRWTF